MLYRMLASLMVLISVPSLGAAATLMPAVKLREGGPAITLDQAKTMTPQALGEALLVPSHLPVTEVTIGPEGMEPPTPPGRPTVTRVKLFLQPVRSEQQGFCERVIASVLLKPVFRSAEGKLPASGPDSVSTQTAYRWVGRTRDDASCGAPKLEFFVPQPGGAPQAFAVVRLLAQARQDARRGRHLTFPLSVEDREGPQMMAFDREHSEQPPTPRLTIITDARKALASLPLGEITFAGQSAAASPDILRVSDLIDDHGHGFQGMTVFLDDWTVGLVIDDNRIVRMRMLRQIPAPF